MSGERYAINSRSKQYDISISSKCGFWKVRKTRNEMGTPLKKSDVAEGISRERG
jgi:hypothetical protein